MIGQKRRGIGRVAVGIAIAAIVVLAGIATSSYLMAARTPGANGTSTATSVQSSSVSRNSSLSQSTAQYPLVWGPNPVYACSAGGGFCVAAILGFSGHTATNSTTFSTTTIIQGNTTAIVGSTATTVIHGVTTDFRYPAEDASYPVLATAWVQDAVTGQNATTPGGGPLVASTCHIQPTGFTHCIVGAPYMPGVPAGDPYKVTVYITKTSLPCPLQPGGSQCSSQLLAPPSPTVTGNFEGS